MLKWSGDRADADGMRNSTPPPGYTSPAKPQREPNYLLRGVLAGAAVLVLVVGAFTVDTDKLPGRFADDSASSCIVNGFGNKLCGGDAIAYCDLQDDNEPLSPRSYEACLSVGWHW
jgi:hypothetical protein